MTKRRIKAILLIIVVVAALFIAAGFLLAKPIARFQANLNAEIADSLSETGLKWDMALTGLAYDFPHKIKGQGYLRNVDYNVLIEIDEITLVPKLTTLFGAAPEYRVKGEALGGNFFGVFNTGLGQNFKLAFDNLKSRRVKVLDTGELNASIVEIDISGMLVVLNETIKADTVINSIKIELPKIMNVGDLMFYDGRLNFEIAANRLRINQALIKNNDAHIQVAGFIDELDKNVSSLDLSGVLAIKNPDLAAILNLFGGSKSPEFRFAVKGTTADPKFKFLP